MHTHDSWEWSVAYQKDRGNHLVLIEKPQHYAWLADIGGFLLCFANSRRWWRLASFLRMYHLAEWFINKSEHKNKELLTIDLTHEQVTALIGEDGWPFAKEDDDESDL